MGYGNHTAIFGTQVRIKLFAFARDSSKSCCRALFTFLKKNLTPETNAEQRDAAFDCLNYPLPQPRCLKGIHSGSRMSHPWENDSCKFIQICGRRNNFSLYIQVFQSATHARKIACAIIYYCNHNTLSRGFARHLFQRSLYIPSALLPTLYNKVQVPRSPPYLLPESVYFWATRWGLHEFGALPRARDHE